ncbi:MAG: hypothetical protein EOP04_11530 [Proteobacteria bacterium]|nr:MAG: hypothetical protein EOP04_11530 [Pseudomonadota bacterium]
MNGLNVGLCGKGIKINSLSTNSQSHLFIAKVVSRMGLANTVRNKIECGCFTSWIQYGSLPGKDGSRAGFQKQMNEFDKRFGFTRILVVFDFKYHFYFSVSFIFEKMNLSEYSTIAAQIETCTMINHSYLTEKFLHIFALVLC